MRQKEITIFLGQEVVFAGSGKEKEKAYNKKKPIFSSDLRFNDPKLSELKLKHTTAASHFIGQCTSPILRLWSGHQ